MADIQLLLAGDGNRDALASVVAEHHTPITDGEFREVDLHIVDESSFRTTSQEDQLREGRTQLVRRAEFSRLILPDIDVIAISIGFN